MPKELKDEGEIKGIEYKELADFLAVKFDEINEKLDRKPDREEVRAMIREDLVAVRSEIERVANRVVRMSDKTDDYRAAQFTLKTQVDRLDKKIAAI